MFRLDKQNRPEIYNLMTLMAAATDSTIENVYEQYKVFHPGEFHCRIVEWPFLNLRWPMR